MRTVHAALVLTSALWAQSGGSVAGSVSSTTTHAGVPGVKVELKAAGGQSAAYLATTDAAGGFSFAGVRPGDYTISFSSDEVISPPPGHPARKPFHVAAGGEPVRIRVELEPWGKLSGRVVDDEGRPVARARVMMERLHGAGGSTATSDPDGRFHIWGMGPGTYVLFARPVLAGSSAGENPVNRSSLPAHPREGERYTWAPTFFPDAPARAQAQPIVVRGGADLSGYEIRLRAAPVFQIRGTVLDERGQPLPKAVLKLLAPYESWEARATAGENGAFQFPAVRPGEWRVSAEAARGGETLKGSASLLVAGKDLEDVTVRLSPPFTMRGFVDRDEPRDPRGKRKVSAVYLMGTGQVLVSSAFHEQDGSLTLKDVYPGRYRIQPYGFIPGYYLDSVFLGSQNVMGQEVDLTPASPPIRVVYRPKAARVRGTVEDGSGSEVYLLPQEESLLNDQFIRSARCENGRFEVGSLRPGDYYAFAFDRVEFEALTEPAFVRALVSQAARVHVEEGEIASVDLRLTPWPE